MNKIDVLLNSISDKHLRVEVLDRYETTPLLQARLMLSKARLHAALLAAFEGGVRHATRIRGNTEVALIREVDIDLRQLEQLERLEQLCADLK